MNIVVYLSTILKLYIVNKIILVFFLCVCVFLFFVCVCVCVFFFFFCLFFFVGNDMHCAIPIPYIGWVIWLCSFVRIVY